MMPCALGCTETCPDGAKAHAEQIRAALLPRMRDEWWPLRRGQVAGSGTVRNTARQRRGAAAPFGSPGTLPPGWHLRAALPDERTGRPGEHLFLVHAPARTTTPLAPDTPPVRLPGLWALIDGGLPHEGNALLASERNLWRLRLAVLQGITERRTGYLYAPRTDVPGWLDTVMADLADPSDSAEAAERTLFLLSGRWRTPPAAALT